MSKTLYHSRKLVLILACITCTVLGSSLYAHGGEDRESWEATINDRINNISSQVELRSNDEVKKCIQMYTEKYRNASENLLGRVTLYFPMFEKKLREKKLPDELKFLALVESNLKVNAKSYVGASGLWQFMKGTGKMYGLKINSTVDERNDPEKATEAALNYLQDLYLQFDDWTLALAAYNCGPGNVRKAIRRSGGKRTYWEIRKFLPRETRRYIPKFVAFSYLMNYYHVHNLEPVLPENNIKYTATAKVYSKVSFKKLSNHLSVDLAVVQLLNPAFIKSYIPGSSKGYNLTLPEEVMYTYLQNNNKFENLLYTSHSQYLQPARSTAPQSRNISSLDKLPLSDNISSIDKSEKAVPSIAMYDLALRIEDPLMDFEYHKLKKRESIIDIVNKRADLNLEEIMLINNISFSNPPRPGSLIKLKAL